MIKAKIGQVEFDGQLEAISLECEMILRSLRNILEDKFGNEFALEQIEHIYDNSLLDIDEIKKKAMKRIEDFLLEGLEKEFEE